MRVNVQNVLTRQKPRQLVVVRKGRSRVQVIGELKEFVTNLVVKLSVNVTAELAEDTPKDTGWAASNWVPAIGAPVPAPFGSKLAVSSSAQEAGKALLIGTYALPQIVHINNPVDYIEDLNSGTSTQAPPDFVQTAIAKAIQSVV